MSADSAVTYTSVNSEARSWSIPSEDPYEEVARQLLEQARRSPEYVPNPMELEDHVLVYIPEPEHPEDLVPPEDEAPTPPLPPFFLSPRIRPSRTRAAMAQMRATTPSTYHPLLPSRTPPLPRCEVGGVSVMLLRGQPGTHTMAHESIAVLLDVRSVERVPEFYSRTSRIGQKDSCCCEKLRLRGLEARVTVIRGRGPGGLEHAVDTLETLVAVCSRTLVLIAMIQDQASTSCRGGIALNSGIPEMQNLGLLKGMRGPSDSLDGLRKK
ncbi:hypothetical protein Tco_0326803 [Tanacetum coccineum]